MKIERILCAVDLAEDGRAVARYAAGVAKAFGVPVLAVYAAPTLSQYVGFHVPANTIDTFVGEIMDGARKNMDDFLAENFPGVQAEGKVIVGYASEEILKVAEEEGCGLIVMGTHGRKGLDRILFGSVAERVVQNSRIPVLTLNPENLEADPEAPGE